MKAEGLVRNTIEIGIIVATGAMGGLCIAWLESAFGISPYWFIAVGTGLAVLATGGIVSFLISLRTPMFVFDWVISVEGLIGFALLSASGLFALAGLIWSGTVLLLIGVGLVGLALAIISYVFHHAPVTTWDDDGDQ